MSQLPSLEVLEKTHRFPTKFTFKAIGRSEDGFAQNVVAGAKEALEMTDEPQHSIRETDGGRHVAVTLDVPVKSAEQILAVYRKLMAVPGIMLLL